MKSRVRSRVRQRQRDLGVTEQTRSDQVGCLSGPKYRSYEKNAVRMVYWCVVMYNLPEAEKIAAWFIMHHISCLVIRLYILYTDTDYQMGLIESITNPQANVLPHTDIATHNCTYCL